jgi:hypothetical protein
MKTTETGLIYGSRNGEGGNQAGFIYHSPLAGQFSRSILMKHMIFCRKDAKSAKISRVLFS